MKRGKVWLPEGQQRIDLLALLSDPHERASRALLRPHGGTEARRWRRELIVARADHCRREHAA